MIVNLIERKQMRRIIREEKINVDGFKFICLMWNYRIIFKCICGGK